MSKKQEEILHGEGWLKHFRKCMERFSGSHYKYDVFTDFIQAALDCFLSDHTPEHPREKQYMQIIGQYKKEEVNLFCDMLGCVTGYTFETGKECLGILWEEYAAKGQLGQFFTPQCVCEMMNLILFTQDIDWSKYSADRPCRISDPSCGAGRMLTTAFSSIPMEHKDKVFLHGIDIDGVVCKATALNMLLLDANSVIIHGNTLSLEVWNAYETNRTGRGFARIREITDKEFLKELITMSLRQDEKAPSKPTQMEFVF